MSVPDQFFSAQSLTTVAGAALAVWAIVNGVRYFFGFHRKWMIFLVSLIAVVVLNTQIGGSVDALRVFLVVANAFLLATTAVGLNETISRGGEEPKSKAFSADNKRFFGTWFG